MHCVCDNSDTPLTCHHQIFPPLPKNIFQKIDEEITYVVRSVCVCAVYFMCIVRVYMSDFLHAERRKLGRDEVSRPANH